MLLLFLSEISQFCPSMCVLNVNKTFLCYFAFEHLILVLIITSEAQNQKQKLQILNTECKADGFLVG